MYKEVALSEKKTGPPNFNGLNIMDCNMLYDNDKEFN